MLVAQLCEHDKKANTWTTHYQSNGKRLGCPALINPIKGTPGYKNKYIFIDCQWLVKTNGAAFIFIGKLGNKFLPGQFWPCLSSAYPSVPSGIAISPDFWSCGPKHRPLYCCDMKLWSDGVRRWGLNGSRQLRSKLRIIHFNWKIIKIRLMNKINFNLRLCCYQRIT